MAKSLAQSILHKYSYKDLKELCSAPDSTFPNVFDCDWGVWREKAVADFGVSERFFDLVRILSGPQRYLQIASYVKLSPLSGVRVYPGTRLIEGVYEAYAGYLEAINRKDPEALLWFAKRIKPEQQGLLRKNTMQLLEEWSKPKIKKEVKFSRKMFRLIKQGDVRGLDKIIHIAFTVPKGFSIEKDIPYVPFWEFEAEKTLYDLPQDRTHYYFTKDMNKLVGSLFACADTRIVDFFRSVLGESLDIAAKQSHLSARKSITLHGKPEQAFGIEMRFFNPQAINKDYQYMSEIMLHLVMPSWKEPARSSLTRSLGNIAYLESILPLLPKELIAKAWKNIDEKAYPLSKSLLKSYI